MTSLLSVVIPTLNEAPNIAGAGASARAAGARLVTGERGRGPQLNLGAAHAAGDVLCFLQTDVRLHPRAGDAMRLALADPRLVGGNFRVDFGPSPHARFLAAFCHVIRQLRVYYGDSAIFCRAAAFRARAASLPTL